MKKRLDEVLFSRGMVPSRAKAKAVILSGVVYVNDRMMDKAGTKIDEDSAVIIKTNIENKYVSRGGLKLEGALDHFNINVEGFVGLDIGASTGGFTDCLLKRGAKKIYAVDVGYGQLDYNLRKDERVVNLERQNFRNLDMELIQDPIDIVVGDLSFISIEKIITNALIPLKTKGIIVFLVKPQFELERQDISRGGIVRDESLRKKALDKIIFLFNKEGLCNIETCESPIKGQKGNVEYLIKGIKC